MQKFLSTVGLCGVQSFSFMKNLIQKVTVLILLCTFSHPSTAETATLEGAINLPTQTNADVDYDATVCQFINFSGELNCSTQRVTILSGSSSINFSVVYALAEPQDRYTVSITCAGGCDEQIQGRIYLHSDSAVSLSFITLELSAIAVPLAFNLPETGVFETTIALPNGNTAPQDMQFEMEICGRDANFRRLGCFRKAGGFDQGQSSVNLSVPYVLGGDRYTIVVNCFANCSPYLPERRYLSPNFETLGRFTITLPDDVFTAPRTIELTEGLPVRSVISLPNGEIAPNDMVVSNSICVGFSCTDFTTTLPAGSNSVLFQSVVPFDTQQVGYRWVSRCSTGCGKYVSASRFLTANNEFSFEVPALPIAQADLPTQVDIQLFEGRSLVGRISRPVGDTAAEELVVSILLCSDEGCREETVDIGVGENFGEFVMSVLPSEAGGTYRLSYRCQLGCNESLRDTIYINQDLEPVFDEIRMPESSLPNSIDLTLQTGFVVRGSISLPASQLAQSEVVNNIRLCSYNSSGNTLGCSAFSQEASIQAGENSGSYAVSVRPAPADGSYRFETQCLSSCDSYVKDVRYLDSSLDLVYDFSSSGEIPALLMPAQFDFTLDQGQLIQGTISLADFQQSQVTPFRYRIRVCSFTAQKSRINCASSSNQMLDFNNGSGSFTRAIRPAPEDGFYQISATCEGRCGLYLPSTQYFSLDTVTSFIAADIPVQLLPSDLNIELSRGRVVSGTVALPGAEAVANDVSVLVQLCSFTSLDDTSLLNCSSLPFTIEQGNTFTNFEVSAVEAPPEGSYRISVACDINLSGCRPFIDDRIYLNSALEQTFERSLIPSATLPDIVSFEMSRGVTVDVEVNLPLGELASNNISNSINICVYSSEDVLLSCSSSEVVILDGETKASAPVSVRPAPINGYYQVTSRCQAGCDSFLSANQSLKESGESGFDEAFISAAALPSNASFTLSRGTVVTGSVTLPNNEVASNEIILSVTLCSFDSDQIELNINRACSSEGVTIEVGQNISDYRIAVVPAPDDGDYQISVFCQQGCSSYVRDRLYFTNQQTFSFDRVGVSPINLPSSIDFVLDSGRLVRGQLLLPDASQAEADMGFSASLCVYQPGQDFASRCESRFITMLKGSGSVGYSIAIRPGAPGSFYQLSVSCQSACGTYLTDTFYLQADASFSFEESRVSDAELPSVLDIDIQRGREVIGLVKLPGSLVAEQNISVEVELCTARSTSFTNDCQRVYPEIKTGESQIDYGVSIRPVIDGGFYTLSVRCTSNCGLFLDREVYLDANAEFQFSRQFLSSSQLPATVDFSLDQGQVTTVSVVTPSGITSDVAIQNQIRLCSFDGVARQLDCSDFGSNLEIAVGDSSSSMQLSIIEAPDDGFYTLSTRCDNGCGIYLPNTRFLQADLSIGFEREFIPASAFPSSVVLPLDSGQVFNFTLALPDARQAPNDILNFYQFCSFNSSGSSLACTQSFDGVPIPQGQNSVSAQVSVRPAPADGFYSFGSNCQGNCGIYLKDRQYLQADSSIGFDSARVPATVFPSNATFTLPSDISVSGRVLIPQNGIASQRLTPAVRLCRYDSQDRLINCVSERLTIQAGAGFANYVLSTKSAPSGGGYRLALTCASGCGSFLSDEQFLKSDLSTTFERSEGLLSSLPESYDFVLSTGRSLVGAIKLPGSDLAARQISNTVEICVYRASGQFLSCRSDRYSIATGSNSVDYQLNIRPAPSGGFYRVSTRCVDGCGQYLNDERFLQGDNSLSFESFNIEADDLAQSVDLELKLGKQINGVFLLPNAEVSNEPIRSSFRICSLDSDNSTLSCKDESVVVTPGASEQHFSTSLRPAPVDGFYRVSTRCYDNCGLFVDTTRYLNQNSEFIFEPTNVPSSDLPDLIEISFTKGFVLSGEIRLPEGQIAQSDIDVSINLCSIDEGGSAHDCEQISSKIKQGESKASYLLSIRPASENEFYQLSARCSGNCDNYISNVRYLQLDGSFNFELARVPQQDFSSTVDIELDQGEAITGVIRLPAGELADRNMFQSVRVCSYNASRVSLDCVFGSPVINQGTSEVAFALNIRPASEGGYYSVSSECSSSCGSFLSDTQYLAPNLEVQFFQRNFNRPDDLVLSSLLPSTVDFELNRGRAFNVELVKPSGLVSSGAPESSVEICTFDANEQLLRCNSTRVRVASNQSVGSSTINILAAPEDGFYRVSNRCISECDNFLNAQRYLTTDGMMSAEVALIATAQMSNDIEFTLEQGIRVSGQIALAGLESSTSNLFIDVTFCSISATGQPIDCTSGSAFISSGEVSAAYSTSKIPKQADDAMYQVSMNCGSRCGEFQQQVHYLSPNGETQLSPVSLSFSELPDSADLTLLKIAPDRYESDDLPRFAKGITAGESQQRSLHLASDEDWVEFTVEQSGRVVLDAVSNDVDSRVALELYNQDLMLLESSESSDQRSALMQPVIDLEELSAGTYLIKVSAKTINQSIPSYTLRFVDTKVDSANDDQICIPIKVASGNIAIVCF